MLSPELWNVVYTTYVDKCLLAIIDEYLYEKFFGLTLEEIEMVSIEEDKEESVVEEWDWIDIPDDADDFVEYIIV